MTSVNKLKPKELRRSSPVPEALQKIRRKKIYFILEDLQDTYNVGGIFRLADALAVECVYLCGDTLTPPDTKIKKASVNTWQWVPWKQVSSALKAIEEIKRLAPGVAVVAVEQDNRSVPFNRYEYSLPVAFVVGHETMGIKKQTIDIADATVEIPMFGINTSLNVIVSLAMVSSHALDKAGAMD